MKLKVLRNTKKMTQQQVADLVGISLRSYKSYENEQKKQGILKYDYIFEKLEKENLIDEEHGILEIDDIKKLVRMFLKDTMFIIVTYLDRMLKGTRRIKAILIC